MEKPILTRKKNWFVFGVAFFLFVVSFYVFDYSVLSSGGIKRTSSLIKKSFSGFTEISNRSIATDPLVKTNDIVSHELTQILAESVDQGNNFTVEKKDSDSIEAASGTTRNENETRAIEKRFGRKKNNILAMSKVHTDPCKGRYVYVHRLPRRFNDDVLKNCTLLVKWFSLCPYMGNLGLGPQIENPKGVLSEKGWFVTNQFFLEVIFHERMKKYKCLTNNSSLASAIYVPYYAGFDIGRYLWDYNTSMRDSLTYDLVKWLAQKKEWKRMWGRDHFFVSGRIAWDFRRQTDKDSDWGSKLMTLPEAMNMTMLSIESTSWSNEFAIPYPTYFHPSTVNEVFLWQDRMRTHARPYLFAFAGAPRPSVNDSIRSDIIHQCVAARRSCNFLNCNSESRCDDPVEVIKVFQNSVFCLQPPGDSYSRRSIFDSILAGCIPVFFHPFSAYAQYIWHLPRNYWEYSMFIPQDLVKDGMVSIKQSLLRVPEDEILAMREEVIKLIPKVIYADPRTSLETLDDAFDIAVKGVLHRIGKVRRKIKEGRDPSNDFAEENSWKKKLSGIGVEGEWDHFLN